MRQSTCRLWRAEMHVGRQAEDSRCTADNGNAFEDAAEQSGKVVKQTGKEAKQATEASKDAAADAKDAVKKVADDVTP